jgi:methionyl-tRNA synthetase
MFCKAYVFSRLVRSDAHEHMQANSAMTALEPWRKDVPAEQTRYFLASARETLRIVGTVLQPFVPGAATQLLDGLGVPVDQRTWAHTGLEAVKCGQVQPVRLFKKIVE